MSFNKRIIPALDKLVEMRGEIKNDEIFLERVFGKGDCFMGSKKSFNYLEEIRKQLNK